MIPIRILGIKPYILFLLLLITKSMISSAQITRGFERLQAFSKSESHQIIDSDLFQASEIVDSLGNYDYISPIGKLLQNKDYYLKKYDAYDYYQQLGTLLSFIGDCKNAILQFDNFSADTLSTNATILPESLTQKKVKKIRFVNFPSYITKVANKNSVIMLNEAHHKPEHRMNLITILDILYKKGYRNLAVEALSWQALSDRNNFIPNKNTGYYTNEPVMSEMLRYAHRLGYKLIPYEMEFTPQVNLKKRDSIQAANILKNLKITDHNKLIIYAGYGHIEERAITETRYMANFFSSNSGIDPLTIDQTRFSIQKSSTRDQIFYTYVLKNRKIIHPSIPYYKGKPFILLEVNDANLFSPKALYTNGRPNWLRLADLKKEYKFIVPDSLRENSFLIQSYYSEEANQKEFSKLIPADQTYDKDNEFYSLFLFPGKYFIIIRDIYNRIIFKNEVSISE